MPNYLISGGDGKRTVCVKLSTIPKGISGKNLELLKPKYEDGSNKSVRVM